MVHVGDPLVEFGTESDVLQAGRPEATADTDAGSVVGRVETNSTVLRETAAAKPGTGIKVSPAVRALARRLEVDLSVVTPTGPGGAITNTDVQRVAQTYLAETNRNVGWFVPVEMDDSQQPAAEDQPGSVGNVTHD